MKIRTVLGLCKQDEGDTLCQLASLRLDEFVGRSQQKLGGCSFFAGVDSLGE
jgi:hypothetical protein